jgi:hypothetical protein
MLAAKTAVDCLVSGTRDRTALWSINTEEDYHEVRSEREDAAGLNAVGSSEAAA